MNASMSVFSDILGLKGSKNGARLKSVVASLLFLSSVGLIGCGRNSSGGAPAYPPPGVRGTNVVRGTYVEGRYVEGGGGVVGARGGYGRGEGGGAVCSIQNLDAALDDCRVPRGQARRQLKGALSQSADQQGLITPEILQDLRLGRRTTQCLGAALCENQQAQEEPQEEPTVEDIKPVEEKVIRRKY